MIVYLVNRNSKFKGPFDIIGPNRQHIIKVGDICLRDTNDGVDFLLVTNSNNSWNACKRVGVGVNCELSGLGNTLLFSFDGLHKRNGNTLLINQLSCCYKEKVIVDFFRNAINILEYKTDFWDATLFVKFLASSQELISSKGVNEPNIKPIAKLSSTNIPSIFARYLNDDLQNLLVKYTNEGKDLKEAYLLLRDKDPSSFRSALLKFLIENPDRTIYDKPSFTDKQSTSDLEPDDDTETPVQEVVHEVEGSNPYLYDEESTNEFNELLNRYRQGDRKALNMLVEKNMRLVEYIASSYKDRGVQHEDLVQEGIIGLMSAFDRFNPSKKVPFAFYAKWWINQSILVSLVKMQTMIKIPSNQRTLYKKIKKKVEAYEQEHGHAPSANEIELEEEIDPQNFEILLSLPDNILELTSGKTDLDTIPSTDLSADDELIKESKVYFVNNIINKLKDRESKILRYAYGIGVEKKTLSEIADVFYLTRERARQIKEKAIRNLRAILKVKGYRNLESDDDVSNVNLQKIIKDTGAEEFQKKKEFLQNKREDRPEVKMQVEKLMSKSHNEETNNTNKEYKPHIKLIGKTILYDAKKCRIIDTKIRGISERLIVKYENGTIDDVKYDKDRIDFDIYSNSYNSVHEVRPKKKDNAQKNIDFTIIENIFDKKMTSYKYFWFMAIISIIKEKGILSIRFRDILIRMAALSWTITFKKKLYLGKQDMMSKYLEEIIELTDLNRSSNVWYVNSHLDKQYERLGLNTILSPLLKNVPYRFLSPWITFTTTQEVVKLSQKMENDCMYALYSNRIVLNSAWVDYILSHYNEICNFAITSFIQYAKLYNNENDVKKLSNNDWKLLTNI